MVSAGPGPTTGTEVPARTEAEPEEAGNRADPAPPPAPVERSRWHMDTTAIDEDGVVGVGADLEVSTLVTAYRSGIFPWPHVGMPLLWFCPDPRAVITLERFHASRSLRRTIQRCGWTTTVDRATDAVIMACSDRKEGSWITDGMRDAYLELSALGWVHSLEVWDADTLVGGIYGVQVGAVFTAESMFHRRTDASKVALYDLVRRFADGGGALVDVQLMTDHLRSLGAAEVPRARFLEVLSSELEVDVRIGRERQAVSRLVAP